MIDEILNNFRILELLLMVLAGFVLGWLVHGPRFQKHRNKLKNQMKKLLLLATFVVATLAVRAADPVSDQISNIVNSIDETNNLFVPKEIEFRLGGVYSQQTGDAGTLIAVEKWDVFIPNLGLGAETVTSGNKQAAEIAYVSYRKLLGNTAGSIFLGGGYDDINSAPLGVVGARLEHRTSKHVGIWTSASYGIETKSTNSRGLLVGAGVSYAF